MPSLSLSEATSTSSGVVMPFTVTVPAWLNLGTANALDSGASAKPPSSLYSACTRTDLLDWAWVMTKVLAVAPPMSVQVPPTNICHWYWTLAGTKPSASVGAVAVSVAPKAGVPLMMTVPSVLAAAAPLVASARFSLKVVEPTPAGLDVSVPFTRKFRKGRPAGGLPLKVWVLASNVSQKLPAVAGTVAQLPSAFWYSAL